MAGAGLTVAVVAVGDVEPAADSVSVEDLVLVDVVAGLDVALLLDVVRLDGAELELGVGAVVEEPRGADVPVDGFAVLDPVGLLVVGSPGLDGEPVVVPGVVEPAGAGDEVVGAGVVDVSGMVVGTGSVLVGVGSVLLGTGWVVVGSVLVGSLLVVDVAGSVDAPSADSSEAEESG